MSERRSMQVGDLYAFGRGKRSHHLYRLVEGGTGETACGMRVDPDVLGAGALVTAARYRGQASCGKCLAVLDDAERGREQLALFGSTPAADPRPDPPAPAPLSRDPAARPRPLIFPAAPSGMMLQEAVDTLERTIDKGAKCPACRQNVALRKRPLNRTMVRILIGLVRVFQTGAVWVKVKDVPLGRKDARISGGEFAKLRWWGLIEEQADEPDPEDDARKRKTRSGQWRPTQAGIDFAYGRAKVDKYVLLYNNRLIGRMGPEIGLLDALGEDFDVRELTLLDAEVQRRQGIAT